MTVCDGAWELCNYDVASGRSVWRHFDGAQTHYRIDEPVDAIVRANAFTRNATSGNRFGDWVKVASVPLNHAHRQNLVRAHGEGDEAYVSRWLNDGDNRAWRSFEGRV